MFFGAAGIALCFERVRGLTIASIVVWSLVVSTWVGIVEQNAVQVDKLKEDILRLHSCGKRVLHSPSTLFGLPRDLALLIGATLGSLCLCGYSYIAMSANLDLRACSAK